MGTAVAPEGGWKQGAKKMENTEQVILKDSYLLKYSRLNLSGLDLDTVLVFDWLPCHKVNKKVYFHSFPCGLSNSSTKKVWGGEGGTGTLKSLFFFFKEKALQMEKKSPLPLDSLYPVKMVA